MTKLSDTQLIILSRACQREDRNVLPLPETLKGGAVQKVVQSLLNKELITEAPAQAGQPTWREDEAGNKLTLLATAAAFNAVGIELLSETSGSGDTTTEQPSETTAPPQPRRTRENTKQAQLIGMLEKGATVEEIVTATGWQKHTVRGAFAGALKKKLGLTITSEKVEGRGRVYRIQK
jgi:hypothetical protein